MNALRLGFCLRGNDGGFRRFTVKTVFRCDNVQQKTQNGNGEKKLVLMPQFLSLLCLMSIHLHSADGVRVNLSEIERSRTGSDVCPFGNPSDFPEG